VLVGMPVGAAAQERGTITGTVVEQATQRPLRGCESMGESALARSRGPGLQVAQEEEPR
jgi:hypothetical protein